MRKEVISNRQGIAMVTLFIMGSTLILGTGSDAKQDAWLAVIFSVVLAIPIIAIYCRILSLFPDKNLYDILNIVFGRVAGRVLALFFVWYAFHLGSLVLRNFQEFIKIVSFPETPEFIPIMFMGILCIWAVKEGIEVLGRFSQFIILILGFILITVIIISMKEANFDNLRPFLYNGFKPVLSSTFGIFSFPFAETVLFLAVFDFKAKRNNPYKVYYYALAIGSLTVFLVTIRNTLVLGADYIDQTFFPSYIVVGLINIGDFFQRIEVTVAVVLLFAGFVKISVCLLAACKGVGYIFKIGNYRQIVAPVGLLMMVTSCFIYQSIMEMMEWAFKVYKYYAFPFQVILPIIIWIVAEIKVKRQKDD
jgi:spore germination protein KB